MSTAPAATKPLVHNEGLKAASNFLRGNLAAEIADTSTGAITDDSGQLTKFHGLYLQDDRDLRLALKKAGKEKAFSFMLRIRLAGGRATPQQWLAIDALSDTTANGQLRITTRQTFQYHAVLKGSLKTLIRGLDAVQLDSIAACGDVNRNVMAPPLPERSPAHEEIYQASKSFSDYCLPKTRAYHEIWINDELVSGGQPEVEPMYGTTYLPRKFKTGFALPPSNDIDIFSQDLGFIAIVENGKVAGYNVTVGGGMGTSHGNAATFPRLADVIGFITPDRVNEVGSTVIMIQRDFGDRTDRKHARFKYTIADRGIAWFIDELQKRLGWKLSPARPFEFKTIEDPHGWHRTAGGEWFFGLHILSGRIKDIPGWPMRTALREIAQVLKGDFRLTPSQNVLIAGISDAQKPEIEAILAKHGLTKENDRSGLRLNALSCVALPTCGLALAESERALPGLLEKIEPLFAGVGLAAQPVSIRVTGCPNGCARPFLAEIGLVGKAPNKYAFYLGAKYDGTRLNKLVLPSITIDEAVAFLTPVIKRYASERQPGEYFGDFCHRVVLSELAAAAPATPAPTAPAAAS
ncbi:NADPH-dependent assimilatory sulfite reductase hemoprotein subunit [Nibricoccus aquaticus]|uniref:NADPH-dependent assimilatory sulfite reductase hemoprotein subunit n=1 Tax=Nibricoccus aquaticus TaxID=2576891 RepID=A0A290QBU5_9BACT|nr:NADPH-dependent assimilatory sulfite reductase hemoprotein subunit [Nibricoccus aquaticus]ATC65923.1 NADPH-dependent assimilatory sulfite reductase hemoprotein subunit [Nibricoccus aquaticus]